MLLAKATAPFRLCGDKIRTPVDSVSKAICFCLETIIDGGFVLILGCYAIVAIMGVLVVWCSWCRYTDVLLRKSCFSGLWQVLHDCYIGSFSLRNRLDGSVILACFRDCVRS